MGDVDLAMEVEGLDDSIVGLVDDPQTRLDLLTDQQKDLTIKNTELTSQIVALESQLEDLKGQRVENQEALDKTAKDIEDIAVLILSEATDRSTDGGMFGDLTDDDARQLSQPLGGGGVADILSRWILLYDYMRSYGMIGRPSSLPMSIPSVQAFPVNPPKGACRKSLALVDTSYLYGREKSRGLGIVTLEPIEAGEFVGIFSGRWTTTTTLDTVQLHILGDEMAEYADGTQYHDASNTVLTRIQCVEKYAYSFRYSVINPKSSARVEGQVYNGTELVCIPHIATKRNPDSMDMTCSLVVDAFDSTFDCMACINTNSVSNVAATSVFVQEAANQKKPMLIIQSERRINAGEELLLNYTPTMRDTPGERFQPNFKRLNLGRMRNKYDNQKATSEFSIRAMQTYYKEHPNHAPDHNVMGPTVNDNFVLMDIDETEFLYRNKTNEKEKIPPQIYPNETIDRFVDLWVPLI
jgi:hypothetical protein